jgi:hypothetical protein
MKNKNNPNFVPPTNFPQLGQFGGYGNMPNYGMQMQNQNPPNMGNVPYFNPFLMGMRNPFVLQPNQQPQNSSTAEIPIE